MIAAERETVVTATDADDTVRIWTAQRKYISKLRKHPKVTELRTGTVDESEWAEFTVPSDQWNPVTGVKRVNTMSDSQKQATADRLALARAQRSS